MLNSRLNVSYCFQSLRYVRHTRFYSTYSVFFLLLIIVIVMIIIVIIIIQILFNNNYLPLLSWSLQAKDFHTSVLVQPERQ